MTHGRGLLQVALTLLAAALVGGILTMHVSPVSLLGAHASMGATAPGAYSASSSVALVPDGQEAGEPAGHAAVRPCHAGATGHGPPASAHAIACDLSAPPVSTATVLGAAALVAVVLLALLTPPSGAPAGQRTQRRGPPHGQHLHLSLCVIRV